jgi:hypothetical protein
VVEWAARMPEARSRPPFFVNRASYAEAAFVLDVYNVSIGFADPEVSLMRDEHHRHIQTVVSAHVSLWAHS